MKIHIVWSFGGLTLLLVAILLLVAPNWTGALTIGLVPAFVVKDNNSDVVGPVVGYADTVGKSPIVAYDGDTASGRRTLLEFKSNKGFLPEQGQVFFAGSNCTGQAYLQAPETSGGIQALTGIGYGVGPDNATGIGADIWLYRSDSAGPGSNIAVMSNYVTTGTPDFTANSKCVNSSFSIDVVTATKAVNVTANFPQPYTASVP